MTQKELLYMEDAVNHEKSIIDLLKTFSENVSEEFKDFFHEEETKHTAMKEKLMDILKEKANG